MRAVITVVGKDRVGILANVSAICAENGVNIEDVTQSVMQDTFCMIMMADIEQMTQPFAEFATKLKEKGEEMNLVIHCMHEDIFDSMHRV
ncbi:MAG: ACT domain-containing protein [Clostridia bacterium]|nr:ACT domain-containing protein [Clostridia bacterium]